LSALASARQLIASIRISKNLPSNGPAARRLSQLAVPPAKKCGAPLTESFRHDLVMPGKEFSPSVQGTLIPKPGNFARKGNSRSSHKLMRRFGNMTTRGICLIHYTQSTTCPSGQLFYQSYSADYFSAATMSAAHFYKKVGPGGRAIGNALIAFGAILPGIGGGMAKAGMVEALYIGEFIGLLFIWLGYACCTSAPLAVIAHSPDGL